MWKLIYLSYSISTLVSIIIFAQTVNSSDLITGGAGWVGAGLLGMVLGWFLLIRLPTNDKTLKELINSRDNLFKEVCDRHDKEFLTAEKERRIGFQDSLKTIIEHWRREVDVAHLTIEKSISENTAVIIELRRTIEDMREAYLLGQSNRSKNIQ